MPASAGEDLHDGGEDAPCDGVRGARRVVEGGDDDRRGAGPGVGGAGPVACGGADPVAGPGVGGAVAVVCVREPPGVALRLAAWSSSSACPRPAGVAS